MFGSMGDLREAGRDGTSSPVVYIENELLTPVGLHNNESETELEGLVTITPGTMTVQSLIRIVREESREITRGLMAEFRQEFREENKTEREKLDAISAELKADREEFKKTLKEFQGKGNDVFDKVFTKCDSAILRMQENGERVIEEIRNSWKSGVKQTVNEILAPKMAEANEKVSNLTKEIQVQDQGITRVHDKVVDVENGLVECKGELTMQARSLQLLAGEFSQLMESGENQMFRERERNSEAIVARVQPIEVRLGEIERNIAELMRRRENKTPETGTQAVRMGRVYTDRDIPRYSGEKNEHPKKHLKGLEDFFEMHECAGAEKLSIAKRSITGKCQNWLSLKGKLMTTYGEFKREFLEEYWGQREQGADRARLYGSTCKVGDLEAHLIRVAERGEYYDQPLTESDVISLVYAQVPPEIQRMIIGKEMRTVNQLRRILQELDRMGDTTPDRVAQTKGETGVESGRPQYRQGGQQLWRRNNYSENNGRNYQPEYNNRNYHHGGWRQNYEGPRSNERMSDRENHTREERCQAEQSERRKTADNNNSKSGTSSFRIQASRTAFLGENERDVLMEERGMKRERMSVPELKGKVFGQEYSILFDSGSEISGISQQYQDQLIKQGAKLPTLPVPQLTVVGATKGRSKVVNKQVYLPVEFAGKECNAVCLVIPQLARDVILGIDFMSSNGVVVDFARQVIQIQGTEIDMLQQPGLCERKVESIRVELSDQTELVSAEEALIKVCGDEVEMAYTQTNVRNWGEELSKVFDKCQVGSVEEIGIVRNLVHEFRDVFSDEPGRTSEYVARIPLVDHEPFKQHSYPIPWAYKEEVDSQIAEMERNGIIERGNSPYINPLVCVRKSDGSVRVCLDARKLNAKIVPDRQSPAEPDELFGTFQGTKFISTLDLCKGFWQVPLHPEDRKYTAFLHRGRCYQFCVLPFGLANSVGEFCRAIDMSLGPEVCANVKSYVDDLVIVSGSFEDHVDTLRLLFERLRRVGLTLKLGKACFLRKEVKFLGFILNQFGISADPEKIKVIQSFKTPKNVKEVRAFLGLCNFYRRFAEMFAQVVAPLVALLKKDRKWEWTAECADSFEAAKSIFLNVCVVYHPDFSRDFYVNADASSYGIGAKLYQVREDGEECLLSFASRTLTAAERAYTVTERECLAVIWGMGKFRNMVLGHHTIIRSDHHSLVFLQSCRLIGSRLTRWCLAMQEFDFEIQFVSGKKNSDADLLSRINVECDTVSTVDRGMVGPLIARIRVEEDRDLVEKFGTIGNVQREDKVLKEIIEVLEHPVGLLNEPEQEKITKWYCVHHGVLFRRAGLNDMSWLICVPKVWVERIIRHVHESTGHFGSQKVIWLLRSTYYWQNLARTVRKIISGCVLCQKTKFANRNWEGPWEAIVPEGPLDLVAVDLYGPLPRSRGGVKYLLVVLDVFTKHIRCYPLKKATTNACVRRMIDQHFVAYGVPRRILSDRGTQFTADEWRWEMLWLNVDVVYTSVRHPQSNPVERCMREIGRLLRTYCFDRHSSWADAVVLVNKFLNFHVHSSTGYAPDELVTGKKLRDALSECIVFPLGEKELGQAEKIMSVREKLKQEAERRQAQQKGRRHVFHEGDLVLLRTDERSNTVNNESKKLFLVYDGPYTLARQVGPNAWELTFTTGEKGIKGTYNSHALKPFIGQL